MFLKISATVDKGIVFMLELTKTYLRSAIPRELLKNFAIVSVEDQLSMNKQLEKFLGHINENLYYFSIRKRRFTLFLSVAFFSG